MTVGKHELVEALRVRYDAYSAETVFEMARSRAGLGDKTTFDGQELAAFRAALAAVGDRVGGVLARIDDMVAAAPEPAPTPAPAKKPEPVEPKKAEPAEPKKAEPVETTIVLTGIEVGDGEQVLVCGAFPALGDWDPERAQPMAKTGDAWLATLTLAPDAQIAFKFLRRTKDGSVIWEPGDDRRLVAKQRLEVTWRATPAT